MHDVLRDFFDGTNLGVDQNIGLAIKRFAHREQLANFCFRIVSLQKRPVRLRSDAFPNYLRRRPKANDERMLFEAGHIFLTRAQPAPG